MSENRVCLFYHVQHTVRTTNRRINRFVLRHVFVFYMWMKVKKHLIEPLTHKSYSKQTFFVRSMENGFLNFCHYANACCILFLRRCVCVCAKWRPFLTFHPFILHHINWAYFIVNRSCHTRLWCCMVRAHAWLLELSETK